MSKIYLDKYYTGDELAEYCINKTFEVIGKENITDIIEPSAGAGSFSNKLNCTAYDIEPEAEGIIQQDFLTLNIPYKQGRLIIGNPPYGESNNLYRKFYNKSIDIGDYIAFIASISQLNNTRQLYKFDLIYSEDLGIKEYSGVNIHCCFNIYKRPANGLNKRAVHKLKDISLYREDNKKYKDIHEDFMICRMGSKTWKILDEGQILRNFKVVINNDALKDDIIKALKNKYDDYVKNKSKTISTPYICASDVYKYLLECIPDIR